MRNDDGTFAGAGTWWSFYEDSDTSHDNDPIHVYLPYDFMTRDERAMLNGPVKTYKLEDIK